MNKMNPNSEGLPDTTLVRGEEGGLIVPWIALKQCETAKFIRN